MHLLSSDSIWDSLNTFNKLSGHMLLEVCGAQAVTMASSDKCISKVNPISCFLLAVFCPEQDRTRSSFYWHAPKSHCFSSENVCNYWSVICSFFSVAEKFSLCTTCQIGVTLWLKQTSSSFCRLSKIAWKLFVSSVLELKHVNCSCQGRKEQTGKGRTQSDFTFFPH